MDAFTCAHDNEHRRGVEIAGDAGASLCAPLESVHLGEQHSIGRVQLAQFVL